MLGEKNNCGQLGIGNTIDQETPQLVTLPNEEKPISISLSSYHSIVLTNKGNLYTWGANNYYQLGVGNTKNQNTPQKVILPNEVKAKFVFCGDSFSFFLGDDDNLYSWGYNYYGQLGIGNTIVQKTPQLIKFPNNVKAKLVSIGKDHCMTIGDDGNLYTWGRNQNGQLGIGNTENKNTPQLVNLSNGIKAKYIYSGGFHSLMIGTDNNLYSWGYNIHGELGIGNCIDQNTPQLVRLPNGIKPKYISAGYIHSLLIGNDGNLYSWGRNYRYSLGLKNSNDQNTPQLVTLPSGIKANYIYANFLNSVVVEENGDFVVWGG